MTTKPEPPMDEQTRLYEALRTIAAHMPSEQLERKAEKLYGLEYHDALEMAYDNVLIVAKAALKGLRKAK